MVKAFLLINCDQGKEDQVIERLHTLHGIKEVQATVGVYDVIDRLESETSEKLDHTIKSKILKIKPVNYILTLQ